jgi:hypothetical protein
MDDKEQCEDRIIEQIKHFQGVRLVGHCGNTFRVPSFDFNVRCPSCNSEIKVRSFSGINEIEDVFDAVFEWMLDPNNHEVAEQRMREIKEDLD